MSLIQEASVEGLHDVEEAVSRARWVEEWFTAAGVPSAVASQLGIVAEEVLVNIVSYAWPSGVPGICMITLALHDRDGARVASVKVEDDGEPFDPTQSETAAVTDLDEATIGGLGIHFLRSFTDRQIYSRAHGRNVLVLERGLAEDD